METINNNGHFKYKTQPGYGLMSPTAHQTRMDFVNKLLKCPENIYTNRISLESVQKNIESFIGAIEIPLGLAGPLLFDNDESETKELIYTGICTTEGALVASINRGAKAISESGGFRARIIHQKMLRTPMFIFDNLVQAFDFTKWVSLKFNEIKEVASKYSNHANLTEIVPVIIGKIVHLRFIFTTNDASGQNMTTICTWHSCLWIEKEFQEQTKININNFVIDGNGSSDKKVSFYTMQNGRGISVICECLLSNDVVERTLRTSSEEMFKAFNHSTAISRIDGMFGYNINVSNVIAGIFASTGQDLGSIHESSMAVLQMDNTEEGLYVSLSLPGLVIGTIGGGTHLPAQRNILELMNCYGNEKAFRFAKIIAGFAMSLELSTLAAIVSGQFAKAHQKLGRNKPINWLVASEITGKFVNENFDGIVKGEVASAELLNSSHLDNGILTNLTKRISKKLIGLIPIKLQLKNGDSFEALLKSKPIDDEQIKGLHYLASCLNTSLADLLVEYKNYIEYFNSHTKEINVYKFLNDINYPHIPELFGYCSNNEREIFLLLLQNLNNIKLKLFDSENVIELWSNIDIFNCIDAIHSSHKQYLNNGSTIDSVNEYNPMAALPLYKMFSFVNRKDYSESAIISILDQVEDVINQWTINPPKIHSAKTLIHNDFNPRNIAIDDDKIYIYDWELAVINIPHRDIFELMAFVLPNSFSFERFDVLFKRYYVLCKDINSESYSFDKYISDMITAGYEFLISRASFYLAGSTLVNYSFIERVIITSNQILQILRNYK